MKRERNKNDNYYPITFISLSVIIKNVEMKFHKNERRKERKIKTIGFIFPGFIYCTVIS